MNKPDAVDIPESRAVNGTQVFSFGDPVPMLDQREIFDYL
ncbi:capsid portal protein, partial [Salmonella enterica subsp. enterica]|nr:capsid portal protein [Salmonella enterica subsp. enterica]